MTASFPAALIKQVGEALLKRWQTDYDDTGMIVHPAPEFGIGDGDGYGAERPRLPDWVQQDMAQAGQAAKAERDA